MEDLGEEQQDKGLEGQDREEGEDCVEEAALVVVEEVEDALFVARWATLQSGVPTSRGF